MIKVIKKSILFSAFFIAGIASACSFGPDADIMKSAEENFNNKDVAVLLKIEAVTGNGDTSFSVEKYYKGSGSTENFTLINPGHSCALTFSEEYVGDFFLMFLDSSADLKDLGQWTPYKRFETEVEASAFTSVKTGGPGPVACTADAMQCEDGSWVGRTGNDCKFVCPETPKTGGPLPVACTMQYDPVCAQQTINCIQAPCPQPEPKTYGNSCTAGAAGAKILYVGECEVTDIPNVAPSNCKAWFDGCNNCVRGEEGGPLACTKKACAVNETPVCNEYFSSNGDANGSGIDFGPEPTGPPTEGFIEPTTPPPSEAEELSKKPNVFMKAWIWLKGLFN